MKAETFAGRVSYDTICLAGFNYWEPSVLIDLGEKSLATAYISTNKWEDYKLVVIQQNRNVGECRVTKWWVAKVNGVSNLETEEELRELAVPDNRIDGSELEQQIVDLVAHK